MYKLVDIVGGINWYCTNGCASGIGIVLHNRGALGVTKKTLPRWTKVLFELAIEKSNIEGEVMQMELPSSEIDFVRTQIRNRGGDFSDANPKQAVCSP